MKRTLALLLCVGTQSLAGEYEKQHRKVPLLRYHNEFKEYYPRLSHHYELDGLPLNVPVVLGDRHQQVKATITQTDPGLVPYDRSLCNVTIEGVAMEPLQISIRGFRTIRAEWVGSNLLYFDIDIGHVASVECLLDIRERKWIYRKSISFNKYSEMKVKMPGASEGIQ